MGLQDVVINQKYLETTLRSLYPNEKIYVNELSEIKNPTTGTLLEVDVWIPSLNICFEFQDVYHYSTVYYAPISLHAIQTRDHLKKEQLQRREESLIIVPYWWSGDRESLLATIEFQRPDLAYGTSLDPISFNPHFFGNTDAVPNIGELMLASFPEHLILPIISGNLWWVGEKFDGIRFCWHPVRQVVYSRRGTPLSITAPFNRNFGNMFIDGEFWCGRGLFSDATRLIYPDPQINMTLSKFVAFDIPSRKTQKEPYEKRYASLLSHVSSSHPLLTIPGRLACSSSEILLEYLGKILEYAGEGIIMYKFNSKYKPGRSNLLFKLKMATATDEEALVLRATKAHIQLQLPNGDTFTMAHAPTTTQIKKGDVVTVSSARQTQHHLPFKPVITCVRSDMTWQQVLASYNISIGATKRKASKKDQEIRAFFEKFAKSRNFDPLIASNWYQVLTKQVKQELEAALHKYNISLVHALISTFRDIGLEQDKFNERPKNFWSDTRNQRNYIIELASSAGYDPLKAKNWLSLYPFIAKKLAAHPISKCYGSVPKALMHIFPDIGIKRDSNLNIKHVTTGNIREKLIEFAKEKGIDPFKAASWYNFKFRKQDASSQIRSLFSYGHTWIKSVVLAFPDLHLDPSQFLHNKLCNHWDEEKNRREFFIQFAKRNAFDPLVPRNWYKFTAQHIKNTKHGKKVLARYAGSYPTALHSLFPNIGLFQMR